MLNICMVGTGYVGLVSGACLADFGNRVICVDIDAKRLESIEKGIMPIYEPGLKELVERNRSAGRLLFTTDLGRAVKESLVLFSAVGTPMHDDGSCDLSYVLKVAEDISAHIRENKVFVQKSTVPVGTSEKVGDIIRERVPRSVSIDRVSNPEFLREGSAIEDFMRPNRVVIGVESDGAREIMQEVYQPLYLLETPLVFTSIRTAELIKYASNAFLATKISFINEIADLCEKVGANVDEVAKAMGLDRRIGPKFLHAGIGYGGSCLPKDVSAIIHTAREADVPLRIINAVSDVNESRVKIMLDKISAEMPDASGAVVAVLGLAFKPNTDDIREAPALKLIDALLERGVNVRAFDPAAVPNTNALYGDRITFCKDSYSAVEGADALLIATEWNEFRVLDFDKVKKLMKKLLIFDCRNIYKPDRLKGMGFTYHSFGR